MSEIESIRSYEYTPFYKKGIKKAKIKSMETTFNFLHGRLTTCDIYPNIFVTDQTLAASRSFQVWGGLGG